MLPFTHLPRQVVIHLVYFVILWLNAMPHAKEGISDTISPCEIILRRHLDFEKHCRGNFGSYIEAHYDDVITNTMKSRTYPALLLGPTGNIQGTVKAYDLTTGRVKKPRSCLLYTSPSPRDQRGSRMPSSA